MRTSWGNATRCYNTVLMFNLHVCKADVVVLKRKLSWKRNFAWCTKRCNTWKMTYIYYFSAIEKLTEKLIASEPEQWSVESTQQTQEICRNDIISCKGIIFFLVRGFNWHIFLSDCLFLNLKTCTSCACSFFTFHLYL